MAKSMGTAKKPVVNTRGATKKAMIMANLKDIDTTILNYQLTLVIGNEEYIIDPHPLSSSAVELVENANDFLPEDDVIILELEPAKQYSISLVFDREVDVTMKILYKNPTLAAGKIEDFEEIIKTFNGVRNIDYEFVTPAGNDVRLHITCEASTELADELLELVELLKEKTRLKKELLSIVEKANSENLEEGVGK